MSIPFAFMLSHEKETEKEIEQPRMSVTHRFDQDYWNQIYMACKRYADVDEIPGKALVCVWI